MSTRPIQVLAKNGSGITVTLWISPHDTIETWKKMIGAKMGTDWTKIVLERRGTHEFRNNKTLWELEIGHGSCVDLKVI
ncbi:hypothetical protein FS842_005812 [Serendipita sp. 407]|nr:hypothetical protein FRC18_004455 [Serendipita sp. 400]KAG9023233.1 hypothetical protein FS842_005812 [Serendipita sp. 407]